jgi:ABC-type antimicrobial peptide transport system permease subunit
VPEPPKLAERLLRWLVGGRDADAVAGDLRETYQARGGSAFWYWGQALSCAAVRFSGYRRVLPGFGQDFTHALRSIRRNPGYAVTAMLCLALALGVNTTLFALLDSLYFRKLPVHDAGRLVLIQRTKMPFCSWREYLELRERLHTVRAASTLMFSGEAHAGPRTYGVVAECVSGNFGAVLQPGVSAGRWFASDAESAAVLSYGFWKSKLNGDPGVLGSEILLEHARLRVVGIGPSTFRGAFPPFASDLWVPTGALQSRGPEGPPVGVIARLVPGASRQSVEAEIRVLDAGLRADPRSARANDPATVQPISGLLWRRGRRVLQPVVSLMSLLCAAVLLIACVNVANLLLSRAAVRERELAIRTALGASRWRLFRARLTESLVIAAGAAVLGIIAGEAAGRALQAAVPSIPEEGFRGLAFGVDGRTALFLVAASILCALFFTAASGSRGHARRRRIYSVVQVTLSLTLLVGTGLLLRAMQHVERTDPGFAQERRLAIHLYGPASVMSKALERARSVPGIEDATVARSLLGPETGGCAGAAAGGPARRTNLNTVDPNYFAMMRVPILRGAGFTNAPGVIVNETMARAWWPHDDPVGKPLWIGCDAAQRTVAPVVGVVRDTTWALDDVTAPAYYLPLRDGGGDQPFSLIARTAGDPYEWSRPLIQALAAVSPELRVYEADSIADAMRLAFWETRWRAALLGSIGALAILLAAIGLYGVVSCSVAQRTREIGVRMAIGAQPLDVQWMFLAEALRLTAIGVAAGLALSAATVRLLRGFLYGLTPFDPVAFTAASLAWVLIAMLASWWPARRATRVDPLTALKYE